VAVVRGRGSWPWFVAVVRGRGSWPWFVAVVRVSRTTKITSRYSS